MADLRKITLLGDPAVGKTSLVKRFVHDDFSEDYLSSIGAKPLVKVLGPPEGLEREMTMVIWDIAGQQSFANVSVNYLGGSDGGIMVADVTRPDTIMGLAHWVSAFMRDGASSRYVIAMNKKDLTEHGDAVHLLEDLIAVMEPGPVAVVGTSALTGDGVQRLFMELARALS